MNNTLNVI